MDKVHITSVHKRSLPRFLLVHVVDVVSDIFADLQREIEHICDEID
jgi:hypothetical protein